jgi:hypothetical protein
LVARIVLYEQDVNGSTEWRHLRDPSRTVLGLGVRMLGIIGDLTAGFVLAGSGRVVVLVVQLIMKWVCTPESPDSGAAKHGEGVLPCRIRRDHGVDGHQFEGFGAELVLFGGTAGRRLAASYCAGRLRRPAKIQAAPPSPAGLLYFLC